jgi:hypothetical protein
MEHPMLISWVDCQETPAKQRQFQRQALAAREWFKQHGPPDAPVFPIGYAEREQLKMGGLPHMVALYARSLAGRGYIYDEHPSFDDYASGVMASEEHAPDFIRNNEEMRRRFPPRSLKWLGPGLYWQPPSAQPERRNSRQAQARERLWGASMRAEDDAVAYLYDFDPAVAFATACGVERTLAIKWEAIQEEMRRRRDPRKVMEISSTRVRELDAALASLPQGVYPDAAAERHLLQILKDLPPDRAWWVSHLVVRYQDAQFDRSQLPADRGQCADVPISELESPQAIRRAAAQAA